eukprot:1157012-Pelagomonas_calceolata.AAC.2
MSVGSCLVSVMLLALGAAAWQRGGEPCRLARAGHSVNPFVAKSLLLQQHCHKNDGCCTVSLSALCTSFHSLQSLLYLFGMKLDYSDALIGEWMLCVSEAEDGDACPYQKLWGRTVVLKRLQGPAHPPLPIDNCASSQVQSQSSAGAGLGTTAQPVRCRASQVQGRWPAVAVWDTYKEIQWPDFLGKGLATRLKCV